MQNPLAKYSELIASIEKAKTIEEALDGMAKADALKAYTRKIGMDLKGQNLFAEAKLRGERRAGELLRGMEKQRGGKRDAMGLQSATPLPKSLSDYGISKAQSSRYQQTAAVPKGKFEDYIKETKAKNEELTTAGVSQITSSKPHVARNAGDNEWYTPRDIIESVTSVLGGIFLDPASTTDANAVVGAKRIFTEKDDGLAQKWKAKSVFMNPPYASDLIGKFCDKLIRELGDGNIQSAIVLINNATETKWFQSLAVKCQAACFPLGRIQFWHPRKTAIPLQGQALLYYGKNRAGFKREFKQYGKVWL